MMVTETAPTPEQQAYLNTKWNSTVRPVNVAGKPYYSIAFTE
ncbi:hypothetical protein [Deinococcus piscis]|nr:hypothetical protein [Deinococcus piscis]